MGKKDIKPSTPQKEKGWVLLYAGSARNALEPVCRGLIETYGPLRYDDPIIEERRIAIVLDAQSRLDRLLSVPSAEQAPTPGNR